ncbi:MAG: isoprenylcysteine carboxylmethyltransferase family protein, partial [Anaerolineales bacterium]|nr:isoprenylcysteine carboxylmethyltransferase family protein [Anaerolineales bacterium]
RNKKVLPPTYLLISIVLMVALHFLHHPTMSVIRLSWNIFGIIPLILGIATNIIADNALHKAKTTVKPFEESAALVTSSVYRISRHPMYLGFVLILVGVAIVLGSLTPFVIIPIFAILMDVVFIQVEERMLEEKFGQVWLEYKRKVRRWI